MHVAGDETVGGTEREHHIGRAGLDRQCPADAMHVAGLSLEEREQVEVHDRRTKAVGRSQTIAIAVDRGGIMDGRTHAGGLQKQSARPRPNRAAGARVYLHRG